MEGLKKSSFEEELMNSVFTGHIEKLSNSQIKKTRDKNEKEFKAILTNSTSMQAAARKEASKIFITF